MSTATPGPTSPESPLAARDVERLDRALALARQAIGLSEPNPRVGCVIHDADDRPIGEGHTQQVGGPHAEVMAMRAAVAAGHRLAGATAWVSLEPCAHHGRTPPCADALVQAGLRRVVVACLDPFAQVAGKGIARLRAAGVEVLLAPPDSASARAARALNIGFFSRVLRRRPWVRLKMAASLDGRTALPDGRSQWITDEAARQDGQQWRLRAGALLTGIGTVLDDNPRLDLRLPGCLHQPLRVVLDSAFRTPPDARILAAPGRVLVVGADEGADAGERQRTLRAAGAETLVLPDGRGRVDLPGLLAHLAAHAVNELHVEAGATLAGTLWQAGLVDELLLYMAPRLLGPGRGLLDMAPLPDLAMATPWQWLAIDPVGRDLRLRLQAPGADAFVDAAN